jgi:hypothetical protein
MEQCLLPLYLPFHFHTTFNRVRQLTAADDGASPSPTLFTNAFLRATTTAVTSLSPACSPVSSAKIGLGGVALATFSMLARQHTFSALQDCFGSDEFGAEMGSAELAQPPVKPLTVALRAVQE